MEWDGNRTKEHQSAPCNVVRMIAENPLIILEEKRVQTPSYLAAFHQLAISENKCIESLLFFDRPRLYAWVICGHMRDANIVSLSQHSLQNV